MATSKNYTQAEVKAFALNLIYSTGNLLLHKLPKLDKRYNFNKEVIAFIKGNQLSPEQKKKVVELKRNRAANKNKAAFTNYLSNPLVKDYRNNKNELIFINEEKMVFINRRNHWAKNETDRKILHLFKSKFLATK